MNLLYFYYSYFAAFPISSHNRKAIDPCCATERGISGGQKGQDETGMQERGTESDGKKGS